MKRHNFDVDIELCMYNIPLMSTSFILPINKTHKNCFTSNIDLPAAREKPFPFKNYRSLCFVKRDNSTHNTIL